MRLRTGLQAVCAQGATPIRSPSFLWTYGSVADITITRGVELVRTVETGSRGCLVGGLTEWASDSRRRNSGQWPADGGEVGPGRDGTRSAA